MLNVLFGRGQTVGDVLTGHEKVRMVSLTGSIATGEHILRHTAPAIKRTHMELGGKAPVIVFDDADLDAVAQGVGLLVSIMPDRIVLRRAVYMRSAVSMMRWSKS